MKIGFLINPIAGMGGPIGLGGSDGKTLRELETLGATPVAQHRALAAIRAIESQPCAQDLLFLTCGGEMGGHALGSSGLKHEVVFRPSSPSNPDDTIDACKEFISNEVDLIVFVGGDGTARDVLREAGRTPILGIPSGVKMHSSVFANTPEDSGRVIQDYHDRKQTTEGEVMDVDEEAFRAGRVSAKLFGTAHVPDASDSMQPGKSPTDPSTEAEEIEEIAEYFSQIMESDVLYLLGTGSTLGSIARKLGIEKNELTINAVLDGAEVGRNLAEKGILGLIGMHAKRRIVVTPIGGQGFVFGRGNQQLSQKVLGLVENEDIVIVAGPSKLSKLKSLRVDTGDAAIDARLRGYWKVMTGYAKFRAMQIQ